MKTEEKLQLHNTCIEECYLEMIMCILYLHPLVILAIIVLAI